MKMCVDLDVGNLKGRMLMKALTMQIRGKHTTIKLEPEIWAWLREQADREGIRLSKYVDEIAHTVDEKDNLASALRVHCLLSAQRCLRVVKAELIRLYREEQLGCVSAYLDFNPQPCMVVTTENKILYANSAFFQWLNISDELYTIPLDQLMTVPAGFASKWERAHGTFTATATATFVFPGRAHSARATYKKVGKNIVVSFEVAPSKFQRPSECKLMTG